MSYVTLPLEYFPDPTRGVPVFNGHIYVGEPNTDPTITGNQKQVTLRPLSGPDILASQPIRTGAGGVALYDGSPVQLLVDGNYSLVVQDKQQAQVYYLANASPTTGADSLLLADLTAFIGMAAGNVLTTSGRSAFGDGGGGVWTFDTSDLSTEVATDTLSGIYAAPDSDATGVSGAWVRQYEGSIHAAWFGAAGDGVTDDTSAIQAMIDFIKSEYASDPVVMSTGGLNIIDGGYVGVLRGKFLISDTIVAGAKVSLDCRGGSFIADTGTTWPDEVGDYVDRITIASGGSGYTSEPTVAITGGGGSGATATAVVVGDAVKYVHIKTSGTQYTSEPTVTITGGGGSGTIATAVIAIRAKPLLKITSRTGGVYAAYNTRIDNLTLSCENVSDGIHLDAAHRAHINDIIVNEAKYIGFGYYGVDDTYQENCQSNAAGLYGMLLSFNWRSSNNATTTNELTAVNYRSVSDNAAGLKTDYANGNRFIGGTLRNLGSGHEAVLNASTTGQTFVGMKLEHDGDNGAASIVIGTGDHNLDLIIGPNTPSVHYKWVENVSGRVVVAITATASIMDDRVDNPAKVGDVSPFNAISYAGMVLVKRPFSRRSVDYRLAHIADWARDYLGNDQSGSTRFSVSFDADGTGITDRQQSTTTFEGNTTVDTVVAVMTKGNTHARAAILGHGALLMGNGTSATDVEISRNSPEKMNLVPKGGDSGPLLSAPNKTAVELGSVTNTINTIGKFRGKMVWESTNGYPLFATGQAAASGWANALGALSISPT